MVIQIEYNLMKKVRELEGQSLSAKERWAKLKEFGEANEDKFVENDILGKIIDVENSLIKALAEIESLKTKVTRL